MPVNIKDLEDNLKLDPAGELLTLITEENAEAVRELLKYDPKLEVQAPANRNLNINLGVLTYVEAVKVCITTQQYDLAGEILFAARQLISHQNLYRLGHGILDQMKYDCKDPKQAAYLMGQISTMMDELCHRTAPSMAFNQIARSDDPQKMARNYKSLFNWHSDKLQMLQSKSLPWAKQLKTGAADVTNIAEARAKKAPKRRSFSPGPPRGH